MRSALEEKYAAPVYPVNCEQLKEDDIYEMMRQVLYEFPVTEIEILYSEMGRKCCHAITESKKRSDRECEENYGADVGSAKYLRKRLEDRKSIHRPDPVGSGRDGHREGYIADSSARSIIMKC